MIALCIPVFLVLLIVLLCFVKLQFAAVYTDSLSLTLKILFLNITLIPFKKKEKKKKIHKKEKGGKERKSKDEKKKKPSYLKTLSDKKGAYGLLSMLTDIAKLTGTTAKGIFNNIVVEKLDISLTVVGEDAADTALKYGKLCGVFYSAISVICDNVKMCDNYNLSVTPDFDSEAKQRACADVRFYIRAFYVLRYSLKALFKLIKIRYKR